MWDINRPERRYLREDIRQELKRVLGDSYSELQGFNLHREVIDDVVAASSFEDTGIYNDTDVKLAVQRAIVDIINESA